MNPKTLASLLTAAILLTGCADDSETTTVKEKPRAKPKMTDDIGEFDAESYPPIAVEVVALNDLETEAEAATEALPEPSPVVGVDELEELAPDGEVEDDDDGFDDEWDGEDPELGVKTQTIAPPPLDDPGPFLDDETQPPSAAGGDPFLDELRRVTNEEPEQDDPITDFLDDDKRDRGSGGWFGRRR